MELKPQERNPTKAGEPQAAAGEPQAAAASSPGCSPSSHPRDNMKSNTYTHNGPECLISIPLKEIKSFLLKLLRWVSRRQRHLHMSFLCSDSAGTLTKSQFLGKPAAILYQPAFLFQEETLTLDFNVFKCYTK